MYSASYGANCIGTVDSSSWYSRCWYPHRCDLGIPLYWLSLAYVRSRMTFWYKLIFLQ